MEKAERDAILRQGIVLPETPRDRRERVALEEDLRSNPARGKPLPLRIRNFLPRADSYLAAARGPLHYMLRLHDIERRLEEHDETLRAAWHALALDCDGDVARFRRRWTAEARRVDFTEVNGLIERHNRWYPVESQLAMDPPDRRLRARQRPGLPPLADRPGLGARALSPRARRSASDPRDARGLTRGLTA